MKNAIPRGSNSCLLPAGYAGCKEWGVCVRAPPSGFPDSALNEASLIFTLHNRHVCTVLYTFYFPHLSGKSFLTWAFMCLHVSSCLFQFHFSTRSISTISQMILWENDLPEDSLVGICSVHTSLPSLISFSDLAQEQVRYHRHIGFMLSSYCDKSEVNVRVSNTGFP